MTALDELGDQVGRTLIAARALFSTGQEPELLEKLLRTRRGTDPGNEPALTYCKARTPRRRTHLQQEGR